MNRCFYCGCSILEDEITCDVCADAIEATDDGQPDEAQEWADYDPDC